MNRMKRKHQPRFEDDGHRLHSQSISKQRIDHSQRKDVPLSTVFRRLMSDITNNNVSSRNFIRWILLSIVCFTDLLRSIDECDDLEVECSSQESSDTEISDDEQSIVQEPLKEDQTERVSFLAALFKKNLSEVKKSPKPKVKAVSSSEYANLNLNGSGDVQNQILQRNIENHTTNVSLIYDWNVISLSLQSNSSGKTYPSPCTVNPPFFLMSRDTQKFKRRPIT
ncbi:hypothetical protein YC2023_082905 [Brassica napus]|uniref:(rape) hypothetical protein n=1 Tax=Brassica napus TaxID=3708 RepID=A0A816LQ54_BRANA|nr:unnamed protein product [Brassica napus]